MNEVFLQAYEQSMSHEGGYANDPNDRGKETYGGISRVHHPDWDGWLYIDQLKELDDFEEILKNESLPEVQQINKLKQEFYQKEYWQKCNCASMPDRIALEVFDSAMNCGTSRARKWLQKSLNALNRNGKLYDDLMVDGQIGVKSIHAIQAIKMNKELDLLNKMLNVFQGAHYLKFMENDPTQEKYARGWFNRVDIIKHY